VRALQEDSNCNRHVIDSGLGRTENDCGCVVSGTNSTTSTFVFAPFDTAILIEFCCIGERGIGTKDCVCIAIFLYASRVAFVASDHGAIVVVVVVIVVLEPE
jgi:hypothetical protein